MINEKIQWATESDAEELDGLINAAYRGDSARQGWTSEADLLDGTRTDVAHLIALLQKADTKILKYVDGGEILGCAELRREGRRLYLGMLTVRPRTQGMGIGKQLMQAAETWAKEEKCSDVYMTVITERRELIDWYVRHGYVDTGERKPFTFDDPRFGQPRKRLEFLVLQKNL